MARRSSTFVRAYHEDVVRRLRTHLEGFSEEQLQRAAMRARVSLVRKVQPTAKRNIRSRYGVRASALNDKFKTVEGRSRGGDPYLGIWASSRKINLIEFNGRWRGRRSQGATAAIRVGEVKTYVSAFIGTVQGVRGIRVRSFEKGASGKRVGRGPLRMLRGPSPLEMLLGDDMTNGAAVSGELLTIYQAEIERQLKLVRRKL
jgi:hypothetical protein